MSTSADLPEFTALGHAGSEHYAGLETFPNPGVALVELESDELVAVCPITGQPDMYVAAIEYEPEQLCLESKSLKLYLWSYRNEGAFYEDVTNRILNDLVRALGPVRCKVVGDFNVRGGMKGIVTVEYRMKSEG